jgi:AcrR family transcriptional regulator
MEPISSSRRTNRGGQRAQQRDATHQRIFEAARKLFIEKGYFDTRSQDIAKEAECSAGSVFAHFESKAKIMTAVMVDVYERRLQRLREARWQSRDARGRLKEITQLLWQSNQEDRDLMKAYFSYSWFYDEQDQATFERYVTERSTTLLSILSETDDWDDLRRDCDVEFSFRLLQSYHENLLRQSTFIAPEILEERLYRALDYLFAPRHL